MIISNAVCRRRHIQQSVCKKLPSSSKPGYRSHFTDPADVMIAPKVGDVGMLEFQRAGDAIEEGMARTEAVIEEILRLAAVKA